MNRGPPPPSQQLQQQHQHQQQNKQGPPASTRTMGPASPRTVEAAMRDLGVEAAPEQEDTMTNLRKTFAGIFGDM